MARTGPHCLILLPCTVSLLSAVVLSHRDFPNRRVAALTVHLLYLSETRLERSLAFSLRFSRLGAKLGYTRSAEKALLRGIQYLGVVQACCRDL